MEFLRQKKTRVRAPIFCRCGFEKRNSSYRTEFTAKCRRGNSREFGAVRLRGGGGGGGDKTGDGFLRGTRLRWV